MNGWNTSRTDAFLNNLAGPVCDALVVLSQGNTIVDWRSQRTEGPMETMSITKSIVSMVVGRLFQNGSLRASTCLCQTLSPSGGVRQKVQSPCAMLWRTHPGLPQNPAPDEIVVSGDVLAFAREAPLEAEPGAVFSYNNRAVNLLALIVSHVTQSSLDEAAASLLFEPLGIENWEWRKDAFGTPLAMSGCRMEPKDLATLGQLMVQNGTWEGEELLSPNWCRLSTTPALPENPTDLHRYLRSHGLLWWLLYPNDEAFVIDDQVTAAWRMADPPIAPKMLQQMERLSGRAYPKGDLLSAVADALSPLTDGDREAAISAWHDATWRRGLPDGRRRPDSEIGFFAQGSLGQFLVVLPGQNRVVVQMVSPNASPADVARLVTAAEQLFSH
jgi:CubicO group peptidase (beta-lactamase class C family)